MKTLIFGSAAMRYWFSGREPRDIDVISPEGQSRAGVEVHWNDAFQYILDNNKHDQYVDPDFLYTIKVSHAAWDVRWDKTMVDIIFLKNKGCKLVPILFHLLYAEWEKVHFPKRLNLNKKSEDFFREDRKAHHDNLHLHFAFGSEPLHTRIRADKSMALTSEKLWKGLTHEEKLKCALEETYVIAVERFTSVGMSPNHAFTKSLKTLIVSATKGYFNLFLIENFDTLLEYDRSHYYNKLRELKNEQRNDSRSAQ